jgi:hypothetical protein
MKNRDFNVSFVKRQRTAALQHAGALSRTPLLPQGLGVRLSSAAFVGAADLFELSTGEK